MKFKNRIEKCQCHPEKVRILMVIELILILYLACYLNICNATQPNLIQHSQSKIISHLGLLDNAQLFDTIKENQEAINSVHEPVRRGDNEIADIKAELSKLLSRVNDLERREATYITPLTKENLATSTHSHVELQKRKVSEHDNLVKVKRWGPWTKWSTCSVSCGKGRKIRWRHCAVDCKDAETEMEEKTCQLPACKPDRLFGVIKL